VTYKGKEGGLGGEKVVVQLEKSYPELGVDRGEAK